MAKKWALVNAACAGAAGGILFGLAVPGVATDPTVPPMPDTCVQAMALGEDYMDGLEKLVKIKIEYVELFASLDTRPDYYEYITDLQRRQKEQIAANDLTVTDYAVTKMLCDKDRGAGQR